MGLNPTFLTIILLSLQVQLIYGDGIPIIVYILPFTLPCAIISGLLGLCYMFVKHHSKTRDVGIEGGQELEVGNIGKELSSPNQNQEAAPIYQHRPETILKTAENLYTPQSQIV